MLGRNKCELNHKQTMNTPLPIEHIQEYDSAAEWCAIRGLKGTPGDPLPANMAVNGALHWINQDPEAFQIRVRQFSYRIAAEKQVLTSRHNLS